MVRSSFYGLNLGYKGVAAQQRALDVTGHNIANANTEGFSRQRAVMVTDMPMYTPNGYIGSGVDIINVERIRDKFLDQQFRNESNNKGYWDLTFNTYTKIEDILNEPIDGSLRKSMDDFWSAWQDLSKDPESAAIRTTVIQKGITAADSFNHLYDQMALLKEDIGFNLQNKVSDVNSLSTRIADINLQIIRSESDGRMANDFRDQRDLLVEELSKIVNIDITEDNRGGMNIFVGGQALVYTTTYNTIQSTPRADGMFDVKWANGSDFQAKNGEMKALIDARDVVVDSYIGQLNTAAKAFAEMTNSVHQSGFGLGGDADTGIPFFTIPGQTVGSQGKSFDPLITWGDFAPVITTQGNSEALNTFQIVFANDTSAISTDFILSGNTLTITADWANTDYTEAELQDLINQKLEAESIAEKIFLNMGNATSTDIANLPTTFTIDGGTNPSADFSASNISVNPDLISDVSKIAAAKYSVEHAENGIGDNGNALKLAQIKYDKSAINGFTVDDYYRSMIGDIGINANKAKSMANNQELLVSQINTQRE
ncbi:MAG: flagellar hook-associated protein FlgK, partial [Eubacteriales bacterium]|nr:flagellar hook-associated protein FlgK [Eubacteriales bacterium]